jgi:hypothetical protein
MAVSDYNTDPDLNVDISGINIAEGCPPSGINNALRQMMADIKDKSDSTDSTISTLDSNVVKLSGAQTITGVKTFNTTIVTSQNNALKRTADNAETGILGGTDYSKGAFMILYGKDNPSLPGVARIRATDGTNSKDLYAKPDGTLTWNGQPIQTSSDERLKTPLADVPDAVLDAWGAGGWGQFQYLDAVAEKGADNARLHLGLIAQRVKAVFEERGLDACKYGILCHDEWEDEYIEDDGKQILRNKAGDLWTVRYTEALAMEAAYQRRRVGRAEARITALEQRLNEMEQAIVALAGGAE